jgi:hypothetical protein
MAFLGCIEIKRATITEIKNEKMLLTMDNGTWLIFLPLSSPPLLSPYSF